MNDLICTGSIPTISDRWDTDAAEIRLFEGDVHIPGDFKQEYLPIDMAHDYRYLLDSIGPNGCVIGVVFHISYTNDKIDNKWIGGICE